MTSPYPQIIRLARSGSLERAWALMEQHGLLDSEADQRALTLQARLVKDRAKRADGAERAALFGESAVLYAKAAEIDGASYPMINAASLSLLAGKAAQAEKLARDVLAALGANPGEAETPYWLGATRAEALLLLGQEAEARAALRAAVQRQPAAWEDHAATIGQFEILCTELGFDAGWLDQIRPPNTLFFSGIINVARDDAAVQSELDKWLERENIGFGYGALAAGADIWVAEALLRRGAELNVILPCDLKSFRVSSVGKFGADWLPRFDRLIEAAASVEALPAVSPSPLAVERGDAVALGLAMQKSAQLLCRLQRLRISDETEGGPLDTATIKAKRLSPRGVVSPAPTEQLSLVVKTQLAIRRFDDPSEALIFLKDADCAAAIDWHLSQDSEIASEVSGQLAAMLECSAGNQVSATVAAGFGLLANGADIRVESGGEMRWAGGQMPLYLIT